MLSMLPEAMPERSLLAILVADMAGYARLMEQHEEAVHRHLSRLQQKVVQPEVRAWGGVFVKNTGDGFLASFGSAVAAVRCALAVQERVAASDFPDMPEPLRFRMGLNLADVIVEQGDVFGAGVNVAARLQTYAEPGGLVVSGTIADAIEGQVGVSVIDLGEFYPKNLSRPVRACSVHSGDGRAVSPHRATRTVEHPSVAVLPFRHMGMGDEHAYFAEGLIEGIIHVLSGLEGLLVISHGAMQGYAGQDVELPRLGRELGVRYVLSGTAQRFGERLRISTRLNETEQGSVVHSAQHDGSLAELFNLQDRVAAEVVENTAPHIRAWELMRARRKPPDSLTAYDLVLQALDLMPRLDRRNFLRARELLQRAIAEDEGYALAWSYAAYWHMLRVGQGWSPDIAADQAEAARAAAAALERDGNDAAALAICGHIKSYLWQDFTAAARLLDRAVSVGPNYALAWSMASATSGFLGDGGTAVLQAERALRLAPRGPFTARHQHMLSQAHLVNGNLDEAVRWGEIARRNNGMMTSNLRTLITALVAVGQSQRAREIAREHAAVEPGFRLAAWEARTPLRGAMRDSFVVRLRTAGLPG